MSRADRPTRIHQPIRRWLLITMLVAVFAASCSADANDERADNDSASVAGRSGGLESAALPSTSPTSAPAQADRTPTVPSSTTTTGPTLGEHIRYVTCDGVDAWLLDTNQVRSVYDFATLPALVTANIDEACTRGFEYRFTRDGEHLAFESSRSDGSTWIGVVELATREVIDVSASVAERLGEETGGFSSRPVSDSRPVFSDRTLLFETTRSDRLYAWDLDTGQVSETPITADGSLWQRSPSGDHYLAHRLSSNSGAYELEGLYLAGVSTVGEVDNARIGESCWYALWIDDDRILCSVTTRGLGSGITLIDLTGAQRVGCTGLNCPQSIFRFSDHTIEVSATALLPDNPRKNFRPVLAPDDDRYAFISELGDERALFVGRLSDPSDEPHELIGGVPTNLAGIPLAWVDKP